MDERDAAGRPGVCALCDRRTLDARRGNAYAIADGHYTGDNAPYAYVTHDYGSHWTKIVAGLPADQWVRAIRPDIRNRNIVYLGTEEGIWISFDGAASWQSFKNGLPSVSVHDIRLQPQYDDLVIATHGRDVYIMDDMTPVQQLMDAVTQKSRLLRAAGRLRWSLHPNDDGVYTNYAADNPPLWRDDHVSIRRGLRRRSENRNSGSASAA